MELEPEKNYLTPKTDEKSQTGNTFRGDDIFFQSSSSSYNNFESKSNANTPPIENLPSLSVSPDYTEKITNGKPPLLKKVPITCPSLASKHSLELQDIKKEKHSNSNQSTDNSMEFLKNPAETAKVFHNHREDLGFFGPKLTLKSLDPDKRIQIPIRNKMGNFPNPLMKKKVAGLLLGNSKFDEFFKSPSSVLSQKCNFNDTNEKFPQIFEKNFEKMKTLGNGHFSTVYQCRHKVTGLIYAIKATKNTIKSVKSQGQILNEAQLLAFFSASENNTNIVKYFNSWIEEKELYIQMEYCDSTLEEIAKSQILSESSIIKVLKDITMGLKSLHKNKVVHLDIKPENILYSKEKDVYKLGDLGLCRFSAINHGEDVIEGDSRYLAQELLNINYNEMNNLTKADIFSLGASLYEIMNRESNPRNGEEWQAIRKGHMPKLMKLTQYSYQLRSLIQKMMHPNFKMRPDCDEILNDPIFNKKKDLEIRWMRIHSEIIKEKTKQIENKIHFKRRLSFP